MTEKNGLRELQMSEIVRCLSKNMLMGYDLGLSLFEEHFRFYDSLKQPSDRLGGWKAQTIQTIGCSRSNGPRMQDRD